MVLSSKPNKDLVRYLAIAVLMLLFAAPLQARSASCPPDHTSQSTPVLMAWREIPIGSPVYALDDAAGARDWLERSDVTLIDAQTGIWKIHYESGYTMFLISPYRAKKLPHCPHPRRYQNIVIKVPGELSVADLFAAIRERNPGVTLDAYHVSGAEGLEMFRTAQPQPQ
jgi:hypothetical protein